MRFLLDEGLHSDAARALDVLGQANADAFSHILDHVGQGTRDEEIPALCKRLGVDVFVTANVKDFGARKAHFQALLAAGVHVVVIRPGKIKLLPEKQVGLLAMHYAAYRAHVERADGPILVRLTPTVPSHGTSTSSSRRPRAMAPASPEQAPARSVAIWSGS